MDGTSFEPQGTLLQRLLIGRSDEQRSLYWQAIRANPCGTSRPKVTCRGGRLVVACDTTLSLDTYFNSFFESLWRRHTLLGGVVLRLTIEGSGILRVFRRAIGRKVLLVEQVVSAGHVIVNLPSEALTFRQYGTLCVELEADGSELVFVAGGWWSDRAAPTTVGLVAVFCTFNREREITRLIETLAGDREAAATLARLIVVNQGRPGLAAHPVMQDADLGLGGKLTIVEQDNFGGAGGFGRGILAALDDKAATHAVLLDDDILIEPDSLLRMAAFFAFCRHDLVVGGHMLDLVQPTLLYEAGAVVSDRHWEFKPQHIGLALDEPASLEILAMPGAVHYNGWWCCGFPLALVQEHGMPLPCFIRGDDVEFGLRLHMAGISTVSMPGIAVWHQPFYLKLGAWQPYYDTRNLLIVASLHLAPTRLGAVRRIGRQVAVNLLTFRYYTAALILAGTEDFLRGPAAMHDHPAKLHASLAAFRTAYPSRTTKRETVLEPQLLRGGPRTRLGCIALLIQLMIRNAVAPTGTAAAKSLDVSKLSWLTMRGVEHIAVETWWDDELPTVRRSREHHRVLLRRAVSVLSRLYRRFPAAGAAWRADMPVFASQAFWRSYLNVPGRPASKPSEPVADPVTSQL